MQKIKAIGVLLFVVLVSALQAKPVADSVKTYSVAELQSDFRLLRKQLEKHHPNLYLYTPKQQFDFTFDSLYAAISKPMDGLAFYSLITNLYAKIKDGHTYFLLSDKLNNYYNKNKLFFPLRVYCTNDKMFVLVDYSDTKILPGTEIVSINGVPVSTVISIMTHTQIRDGYSDTYPLWSANNWFRPYYSYQFGHPAQFTFVLKGTLGTRTTVTCKAVPKNTNKPGGIQKGISLEIKGKHTAVLQIRSFHNAILNHRYHQHFKKEINSNFSEIFKMGIDTLILDLRGNEGGHTQNAQLLLSYLLDKPYKLVYKGPSDGVIKPKSKIFNGKLFCLINGGSFSAASMVVSVLQENKRAVFVGEETAGNRTVISGSARSFNLPNTKINCTVSRKSWQIRNAENDGRGVIPDYKVVSTIDDIIAGKDAQLELILKLIKEGK
jgi:hypothetical protein